MKTATIPVYGNIAVYIKYWLASRGAKAALANLKVCGITNMPIFVTGSKMKIRGEGAVTFNRQMAKYGNFTQHS